LERAVWIVHGDAQARSALARMAGLPALSGPPRLEAFPRAPSPGAVVLHVPLAANEALDFAHAAAARHPQAYWLLISDPGLDAGWLRAAFAGLRTLQLAWPLQPAALQQALRHALAGGAPTLAARRQRDALVARFARTLGDLAIPEPVLDASGHLAISAERGAGKLLLARTLHALWDTAEDEGRAGFVLLAGDASATAAQLEARIAEAAERADRLVVCVEDPAAFSSTLQRELASWVELGAPGAAIDPTRLLWVFLRPESFGAVAPLDGALAELCESPALRIPPLRERPGAALRLAEQWLREWYAAKNEPPRALAESARDAIAADPWPGNARELEAALRRAVAAEGGAPIEADALGLASGAWRGELPGTAREAPGEMPRAGDAREFSSVIEELDAARAAEAAGEDYETTRDAAQPSAAPVASAERPEARTETPPALESRPEPAPTVRTADPILPEPETPERAAVSPAAAPPPAAATPDLRAFARAAARELAPALDALRARADDPAATLVARRLARLEQFAALEADATARTEVAPLLAALLAELRDELLAKRLLVLRELESDDTEASANEPALRFVFSAVLDTLLEAAPRRSDLYVSARPTLSGGRPLVRVDLRLRNARPPEIALDLALARDLLTRLGASLTLETSDVESRITIDLQR
jgi:DNA-binding NtrC family response regulator